MWTITAYVDGLLDGEPIKRRPIATNRRTDEEAVPNIDLFGAEDEVVTAMNALHLSAIRNAEHFSDIITIISNPMLTR